MNTTKTQRPGFWLRAIEYRKHELGREERRAFRDTLADRARDGITDEDYATTMATLEKMARNLGWDEEQEVPGRGFGPFGRTPRGFGPVITAGPTASRRTRRKSSVEPCPHLDRSDTGSSSLTA